MLAIIGTHLFLALVAPYVVRQYGRGILAVLALAPVSAVIYALAHTRLILDGGAHEEVVPWIPGLGVDLVMRMDALTWLMTLIVGGVGALVLLYASAYFSKGAAGLSRFAGVFTGFIAMMLGVVQADHTMILYVFWEGTSLLSFLLIGHHFDRRPARVAARQALLVTTFGSLAMFVGFVMMGLAPWGSFRIHELVAYAASGALIASNTTPYVTIAGLLILMGAFSKSALVPGHFWLPGAMAAPTPVSAYLHAAAMVKAGVYLIARLTPGLSALPIWSPLVVTIGCITMVVGGYRSLKQYDLKLVLAYGTVSQLGLMTACVGAGSHAFALAGLTLLVAHSLFKSALFLTVGAVEKATGTRDFRRLTGVAQRLPVLAGGAALAAASMAGLPLTTGYLGKEALIAALLHGSEATWLDSRGEILLMLVVAGGSVLTVAYSWRFWWGAFGTRQVATPLDVTTVPARMLAPIVLLASGALLGVVPAGLENTLAPALETLPGHGHLAWWSGWEAAIVTGLILMGGALISVCARRVDVLLHRAHWPIDMVDLHTLLLRELEILSARFTRATHRGSLPAEIFTMVVAMVGAATLSLIVLPPSQWRIRWWDYPLEVLIAAVIIIGALMTARAHERLTAIFALGAVGLGVAVFFAIYGAPDLALTQILVESVGLMVLLLVLRRLPWRFSERPVRAWQWMRGAASIGAGMVVFIVGLAAASARIHTPDSALMPEEAYFFGHGKNIVNVILVDIRAWDTVGELSVMVVIATGVASLIHAASHTHPHYGGLLVKIVPFLRRWGFHSDTLDAWERQHTENARTPASPTHSQDIQQTRSSPRPPGQQGSVGKAGRTNSPRHASKAAGGAFLPTVSGLRQAERSIILEVTTRLLFPIMLLISLWLLFIGHNQPGGGFAGGVVAGLAFVLRYLAGGSAELERAMPVAPGRILGTGIIFASIGALSPLLWGKSVVESTEIVWHLGVLGELHFTTAVILDVGVYILVMGLVIDLVTAAGSQIDRHGQEARS